MTKINKIKIKANGKYLYVKKNITVKNLLDKLNIPIKLVAIELNKKIVNKTKLNKIILKSGDKLEIVHFIGGG